MKERMNANPNGTQKRGRAIEHWHLVAAFLIIYDLVVGVGSYFVALWLRFDCRFSEIPYEYLMAWLQFAPIYMVASVAVFCMMHLYQSIWRFASYVELKLIAASSAILGVLHAVLITVMFRRMPASYYVIGISIQFMFTVFFRTVLFCWSAASGQKRCSEQRRAVSC